MEAPPLKIALLGAESTGKTQLSAELAAWLRGQGRSVAVVPEVLREWCMREGRTPRPEEQMPIAQEQERRVDEAALGARYRHLGHDLADGRHLQRDAFRGRHALPVCAGTAARISRHPPDGAGPAVGGRRPPARRPACARTGGRAGARGAGAGRRGLSARSMAAARKGWPMPWPPSPRGCPAWLRRATAASQAASRAWVWTCDKCSDPECEHRLFTSLAARPQR